MAAFLHRSATKLLKSYMRKRRCIRLADGVFPVNGRERGKRPKDLELQSDSQHEDASVKGPQAEYERSGGMHVDSMPCKSWKDVLFSPAEAHSDRMCFQAGGGKQLRTQASSNSIFSFGTVGAGWLKEDLDQLCEVMQASASVPS